eukprot:scaffold62463_cov21-Tisochrysis_lutea.AAC.3
MARANARKATFVAVPRIKSLPQEKQRNTLKLPVHFSTAHAHSLDATIVRCSLATRQHRRARKAREEFAE